MNLNRLVGLIVIALLLFFVFTRPTAAANIVTDIAGLLKTGADQIITFVTNVV